MKLHERIAKLLAKAEATDSLEEAAAYVAKAQELATLYAIDLRSVARTDNKPAESPTHRTQVIGKLRARANKHLIQLFACVASANDTQVDVAANSTYVISYGLPSDLDVVEQLWTSLAIQMTGSATDYLAGGAWRREGLTSPQARATFQQHFIHRIGQRLQTARQHAVAEYDEQHHDAGGALVLLRNTAEAVAEYRSQVSNARGRWRGYSGALGSVASGPAKAGRAAADRARLAPADVLPGGRGEIAQ